MQKHQGKVRHFFRRFKAVRVLSDLFYRYFSNEVGVSSAALAYYLLFSIFPLCILFSLLIGSLKINPASIYNALQKVLPHDVLSTFTSYLVYVQTNTSRALLTFSVVFSIYFPWRAVRGLMQDIRRAFGQDQLKKPKTYILRELACTLLVPGSVLISLLLILLGRNVIIFLVGTLPLEELGITSYVLSLWEYLRFAIAAFVMGFSLCLLYKLSLNGKTKMRTMIPGTIFAIVFWVIAGWIFSFYTEHLSDFSVIYGTLTTVIILMLWLYLTGVTFIMGGEFNAAIAMDKPEDEPKKKPDQE